MHEQWGLQPAHRAEVFFRGAAVVSNGGINIGAGGRDEYHERAEAISEEADLTR